jgi:hypothetical protein
MQCIRLRRVLLKALLLSAVAPSFALGFTSLLFELGSVLAFGSLNVAREFSGVDHVSSLWSYI